MVELQSDLLSHPHLSVHPVISLVSALYHEQQRLWFAEVRMIYFTSLKSPTVF